MQSRTLKTINTNDERVKKFIRLLTLNSSSKRIVIYFISFSFYINQSSGFVNDRPKPVCIMC
jgi:hypothetical protein